MSTRQTIRVIGARQHNLKNINVSIPRDRMTLITGLSGSGKSTLAFNTIYAEGERKYVESLSAHARQFIEQMPRPDVDRIEGLSPTIAIEQRANTSNPRSTVATITEIYDALRILFAYVGEPNCPECGQRLSRQSVSRMVDVVLAQPVDARAVLLAPWTMRADQDLDDALSEILRKGFLRVRLDGRVFMIEDVVGEDVEADRVEVVVDRLKIKSGIRGRLADSLELALGLGGGRALVSVGVDADAMRDLTFSLDFTCPDHPDVVLGELSPRVFGFNSPYGACPECHGLGAMLEFDAELIVPDRDLSLAGGAIAPWRGAGMKMSPVHTQWIESFCEAVEVSADAPFRNLTESAVERLMHGSPRRRGRSQEAFEGVIPGLRKRWESTESDAVKQRLHQFLSEAPCKVCGGARLKRESLAVTINGANIFDVCRRNIEGARKFFDELRFTGESAVIADQPLREIRSRLRFLDDVGVGYLSLSRGSATLSGGEAQRIRLGTQIGSGLIGVCYVLDEPTIGLHQRDTRRLVDTLTRLAADGNTVLVVEHDEDVIAEADHVIDIGPGAGAHGGEVVFEGSLDDLLKCEASSTADYLTGRLSIPVPEQRRALYPSNAIELRDCAENNLKNITVRFPLGGFVCVTGVSGSGKSTLVSQILLRALRRRIDGTGPRPGKHERVIGASRVDKIIEIDQAPIGRTPRSNPATYVGVFDLIRRLYAQTREAKIRGFGPGRFSFNVKGGRCEHCQGQGARKIEMHFLPDVFVECDACSGTRYNRETLEVRYRGKSVADVLDMRVDESGVFFKNFPKIKQLLRALIDVGLGYVKLGQSSVTLSGGEAQRVKLAAELGKSATGHTLYILDEPTTGLHFADIHKLLNVLNTLVARGHTVVVVEHNLDVVKVADWVIDLGPEGGEKGGRVVVEGVPEQVAKCRESYTGRYLKDRLKGLPPIDPDARRKPSVPAESRNDDENLDHGGDHREVKRKSTANSRTRKKPKSKTP